MLFLPSLTDPSAPPPAPPTPHPPPPTQPNAASRAVVPILFFVMICCCFGLFCPLPMSYNDPPSSYTSYYRTRYPRQRVVVVTSTGAVVEGYPYDPSDGRPDLSGYASTAVPRQPMAPGTTIYKSDGNV